MYGYENCWLVPVVEKLVSKASVNQYEVRSMMVMAASVHSLTSLLETREHLVEADLDFLLSDGQNVHEGHLDEWCNYALLQEEERMQAALPQRFPSPCPPPRYCSSSIEVQRGLYSNTDLFLKKGTPAYAVTYPARSPGTSAASN